MAADGEFEGHVECREGEGVQDGFDFNIFNGVFKRFQD